MQLCLDALRGGGPQLARHLGVHDLEHRLHVGGPALDGPTYLVEPLPPVVEVEVHGGVGVGESGTVAGQERAQGYVKSARDGVRRAAKLASQLLAFSRRQPLEPKTVNLGRFVTGLEELLRRTLGEGIGVQTVVADGLWNSLVDPTQVENALLNLAINARDAMQGSGRLTIEARNALLDEAYARQQTDLAAGQYVLLTVTDTGSGMAPEVLLRAFEPFFSTKPEGHGTGLGLSMV